MTRPESDREMVVNAGVPMALVAPSGSVVTTSPAWNKLFGASVATVIDAVAVADRAAVTELLTTASAGDTRQIDVRPRADDAKWIRLQASRSVSTDVLLVGTDVSDVRAELADTQDRISFMEWQALSLSTFAKVISTAPIVLFATDAAGVTTMSDGKGLELIGLTPGQGIGTDALKASEGTARHDHMQRALSGEAFRALVEPVPGVHFDTWYMPQNDENGRLDGVLSLSVDATERVVSERRLAEKMQVIESQAGTIRDLTAPIIKVWDEILCMPIIGTVDIPRAADMTERLLEAIVRESARFAILDLTGVDGMDTETVHHTVRILAAARAVGAVGVLSGARAAVAQSIGSLGVDLGDLRTMRTLHDALAYCLDKRQADAALRTDRASRSAAHGANRPGRRPT